MLEIKGAEKQLDDKLRLNEVGDSFVEVIEVGKPLLPIFIKSS